MFGLTVTRADGKADTFIFAVEYDVESLHDDSAHNGPRARLWHGELVAVLLRWGHVLNRPEILLQGAERDGGQVLAPNIHIHKYKRVFVLLSY